MKRSEVDENEELSLSKRRMRSDVKEVKRQEDESDGKQNDEKRKRNVKYKEDTETIDRRRKKKENLTGTGRNEGGNKKEGNFGLGTRSSEEKVLAIVPPDGGWGWVVVFVSFLTLCCSDGSLNSYGAFAYHIEADFHIGIGETSLVNSIAACLYYVCGPVWGALGNRFGFRSILVIGSALMATANTCAFFITNNFFVFGAFYALGIGLGGGMVCMAAYVMVGVYFERWRGYATSIISCGSSLGTVFMPPAYTAVSFYGWRFILILHAVLLFGCAILGWLARPLKPTLVPITSRQETKVQFKEVKKKVPAKKSEKEKGKLKTGSAQKQSARVKELAKTASFVTLKGAAGTVPSSTSVFMGAHEGVQMPPTEEELEGAGAKPMYRDDIFYPASSARLGSQVVFRPLSGVALKRFTTTIDIRAGERRRDRNVCKCCPPGVRRALAALLDTSLLRSPVFLAITLSQAVSILGYHAPLLFTYARAKASGMDEKYGEWLLPILGISNTIGRLLCGVLVELPHVSALYLTYACYATAGIFSIVSCFDHGYELQFIYVAVLGLMTAAFMAMKSIILVDYLGIERLTNAFGLLLMFQGFAALCGPPLAGFIADATGNYDSAFYCSGTICVVGGMSGFLVIPLKNYEIKKGIRDG